MVEAAPVIALHALGVARPIIVITGHGEWGAAQHLNDLGETSYLLIPMGENKGSVGKTTP